MLIETAASFVSYVTIFMLSKKFAKLPMKRTDQGYESLNQQMNDRVLQGFVSIIQSTITSTLMLYCYIAFDHDPERPMYYLEELAFSHDFGFVVFDLLHHYYNKTIDIFFIWHHVGVILIYIGMFTSPQCIYILLFTVGTSEITNPCITMRMVFHKINFDQNSKIALINTFSFGVPFLIIRAIFCTQHFYYGFMYTQGSMILKFISIVSHSLSIVWSYQVLVLLWKLFPLLFKDSQKIEESLIWRKGRELMLKVRKDSTCSMYFSSAIFSLTVLVPCIVSIIYSPYGIY